MTNESSLRRYRQRYATLLRLYPKEYHQRFGEGMEQTFSDLLRERVEKQRGVFNFVLWMFCETFAEIMKNHLTSLAMHNTVKRLSLWAMVVGLFLLVPLVAMQFSTHVAWTGFDFVFAGALLFGAGLTYELIASKMSSGMYRAAIGLAVVTAVLLVWVNGAVGIIGDGPANLMYAGVLVVGFIGALIARFHPRGMSRTLFAMALAQALVPVIALIVWKMEISWAPGVVIVCVLNTFFVALWAGSGVLFRHAAAMGSTENRQVA